MMKPSIGNGFLKTDLGFNFRPASVDIQNDGKIIVGGSDNLLTAEHHFALVRYTKNGLLDSSFGENGIRITQASQSSDEINDIKISGDKLYAVGYGQYPGNVGILARYFLDNENKTPPTVSITSPVNNAKFGTPADITLTAKATDTDGNISKVEFYNGTTLLHTENYATYSFVWKDVPVGDYTITAKAYDNDGNVTTSAPVHITVTNNKPPTVKLTSPVDGGTYITSKSIALGANASDVIGTIKMVQFYHGNNLIGTEVNAPYYRRWYNVPAGDYTITAKATDNNGAVTVSAPVHIHVIVNQPPTVNITSPVNGASYAGPATFLISANANDVDGTVNTVEFYNGTTLLHTERYSRYEWTWKDVAPGTYTITAKATDNWGAVTTSAPVNVTVTSPNNLMVSSRSSLTGKVDLNTSLSLLLSPNPARDILNIATTGLQQNRHTTVSIISILGVTMKTLQISGSNQTIPLNVSSLASGVYNVRIVSGDKIINKQFVKL